MRCCRVLFDTATHEPLSYGACGTFDGTNECRCARGADCNSGACTPRLNASGNPVLPYRCIGGGTCAPYGTCTGLGSCPNGYCNLCDAAGNCFCAQVCTNDSMCGVARCAAYSRSVGSCPSSQLACTAR